MSIIPRCFAMAMATWVYCTVVLIRLNRAKNSRSSQRIIITITTRNQNSPLDLAKAGILDLSFSSASSGF
jgi:hypothetical protein